MTPRPPRIPYALAAWMAAVLVLMVGVTREGAIAGSLDDVFVVLHEARGWAASLGVLPAELDGPGLVRPAVEGSTSAVDTGVKLVGLVLAPEADPLALAGWTGLLWMVAGAGLMVLGARVAGSGPWLTAAVAVGWASSLGLVEAAGYRLEGPLFALVWTALLVAALGRRVRGAFLLAVLLAAVRPEGLVLGPAAALWARRGRPRLQGVGFAACSVLPILALRLALFGSWAPQSYRAKSSDSRVLELLDGLGYLDGALRTPAGVALLLLTICLLWSLWIARDGRGLRRLAVDTRAGLLGLGGLAAAVLIASGGDGYVGARLALPLAAPLWLAVSIPARAFQARIAQRAAVSAALCLQLLGTLAPGAGWSPPDLDPLRVAREAWGGLRAGPSGMEAFSGDAEVLAAAEQALAGETLAHRHAQRFRWFAPELEILDLTGLTSAEVGSLPAPGRVTFGRDAIDHALSQRVGALHLDVERARPRAQADHPATVLADPTRALWFVGPPRLDESLAAALDRDYVGASLAHPGAAGWFNLLVRRDLAQRFRDAGFRVGP